MSVRVCVCVCLFFCRVWVVVVGQSPAVSLCTEIPNMRGTSSDCLGKRTGEGCTISPGLTDAMMQDVILWRPCTRG